VDSCPRPKPRAHVLLLLPLLASARLRGTTSLRFRISSERVSATYDLTGMIALAHHLPIGTLCLTPRNSPRRRPELVRHSAGSAFRAHDPCPTRSSWPTGALRAWEAFRGTIITLPVRGRGARTRVALRSMRMRKPRRTTRRSPRNPVARPWASVEPSWTRTVSRRSQNRGWNRLSGRE
jgi:hypothetical protein